MAYIGNPPANRFVAPKAATQFSGDGSTTAFTLDHAVGSDEDILVSVDGVIQEPSVAYAVSNGTTLTFTAAPSSNSGNNIFVYYLFRTVGTVSHPSNNALQASDGTFTGDLTVDTDTLKVDSTNNRVGVGTASPSQALHVAGGNPAAIIESTTSTGSFVQFKNTSSSNTNRLGYAVHDFVVDTNGNEALRIDDAGHTTKPLQPAFLVKPASTQSNIALSQNVTVVFGTEVYDVNSDFASNTFTAPVTGKYSFQTSINLNALDSGANSVLIEISTSNRFYRNITDPDRQGDLNYFTQTLSCLADMDANDTAIVRVYQGAGTQQLDVSTDSHFSGFLAC